MTPVTATAIATVAVGVTANSAGEVTSAPKKHSDGTATAANTLWQRQDQPGTSRSFHRTADTAIAKAQAANSARAKRKSTALAKQQAATQKDRKAAAASAKKARAAAAAKKRAALNRWTCFISGCGGTFTSGFGSRWGTVHLGDDFATPIGTPLHALHSGTVVAVGYYYGMGNRVEIDYGNGIHSIFAHLSSFNAYVGQRVSAGQVVGYSGNTGHSTGPHVHVEIHVNGQPIDPAPWLRAHGIF